MSEGEGVNDYRSRRRVAFLCIRNTAGDELPGVAALLAEQATAPVSVERTERSGEGRRARWTLSRKGSRRRDP